jgi:probable HAF family extracellular repeat protein
MRSSIPCLVKVCLVLTALVPIDAIHAQSFHGLGPLRGPGSRAWNVSVDGEAITGTYEGGAFLWTAKDGMQDLGTPDGFWSTGFAVSADGVAVAGSLSSLFEETRAFRWTPSQGMQDLGVLPGAFTSTAYGISADGSAVSGTSTYPRTYIATAFIWTEAGGMQSLGTLPGGTFSVGGGMSADGSVIVGHADAASGATRAFRWTAADGMVDLGTLPNTQSSYAIATSADGFAATGMVHTSPLKHAFLWTATDGMQDLGTAPGAREAVGYAVSNGGLAVVGSDRYYSGTNVAYLWTHDLGMVDLNVYLPTLGIDLTGWTLETASGISADGTTIVGWGEHEYIPGRFREEAWIATVPAPCLADIARDGEINADDLFAVLEFWGPCVDCLADFFPSGGNDEVNIDEVFALIHAWGACQ